MLGRPASWWPVCTKVMAGSWLMASVTTDLTKHRSSTTPAVWGSSSLTGAPHLPCVANLNAEPASGSDAWKALMPVSRWPPRTDSGKSWPCRLASSGFGSNRSSWLGPPAMNR